MSPLRIIGYLGITLLGILNIFIFYISITKSDWKGLFIGIFFFCLLAFFAYSLVSAAKRENNSGFEAAQPLGWHGVPFQHFFYGVMLKSFEGWLVLICAGLCLINIIMLIPNWSWESFLLWVIYPWVSFVVWIRMASPDFRFRLFSIRSIVSISALTWLLTMPAKTLWFSLTATQLAQ